jgi:hypothetical protein
VRTHHDHITLSSAVVQLATHMGVDMGDLPRGLVWNTAPAALNPRGLVWNTAPAALNPHAHPGWSFYSFAWDPLAGAGVAEALRAVNGTPFAASEWLYLGTNGTGAAQWTAAVNATLNAGPTGLNSRAMHVYNWGTIKADANALAGVRQAVSVLACVDW